MQASIETENKTPYFNERTKITALIKLDEKDNCFFSAIVIDCKS